MSLSRRLFGRRKPMQRSQWAQHESGGGRERERERGRKKRKAEGSKGFTARSLAFQVMDMLVLV